LAVLKTAIIDNQVKAIFTELGTSPVVSKAIGDETGVKVVELTTHACLMTVLISLYEKHSQCHTNALK